MADNLALWNSLSPVDPAFAKPFNRGGGFKGTAINSCWVLRRLTETFGPVGQGWRLVVEREDYVPGHAYDASGVTREMIHVLRGHLEYRVPGGEWFRTSPQYGQTTFVGCNKNGLYTDEEAPKKSLTDCLGKCAAQLGLGADIYLGLWDDNKYVNVPKAGTAPQAPPAPLPPPAPVSAGAANAMTPAALWENFKVESTTPAYHDAAQWEAVCKDYAAAYTRLNQPVDPASQALLAALTAERTRLDVGIAPPPAAVTAPPSEASAKRTRTKKIAA